MRKWFNILRKARSETCDETCSETCDETCSGAREEVKLTYSEGCYTKIRQYDDYVLLVWSKDDKRYGRVHVAALPKPQARELAQAILRACA